MHILGQLPTFKPLFHPFCPLNPRLETAVPMEDIISHHQSSSITFFPPQMVQIITLARPFHDNDEAKLPR